MLEIPHPTSGPPRSCPHPGQGPKTSGAVSPPSDTGWPSRNTSPGFWRCLEHPVCQACAPVASPLPSPPQHGKGGRFAFACLVQTLRWGKGAPAQRSQKCSRSPLPLLLLSVPQRWVETGSHPTASGPPAPPGHFHVTPCFCHPSSAQNLPSLGVRHILAAGSFKQDRESFASGPRTVKQSSFLRNLEDGPIRQDAFAISPGAA